MPEGGNDSGATGPRESCLGSSPSQKFGSARPRSPATAGPNVSAQRISAPARPCAPRKYLVIAVPAVLPGRSAARSGALQTRGPRMFAPGSAVHRCALHRVREKLPGSSRRAPAPLAPGRAGARLEPARGPVGAALDTDDRKDDDGGAGAALTAVAADHPIVREFDHRPHATPAPRRRCHSSRPEGPTRLGRKYG